jgi:hypothetical protein
MAGNHGARQQKRITKQKAKKSAKRAKLLRRSSLDPTIRLASAAKWSVVQALMAVDLWSDGIGYLALARRDSEGQIVFASFLVDVLCLGVKDAMWDSGTLHNFKELIERMEKTRKMRAITPGSLVKIVQGAVDYAKSFGFPPHPDYRHAAMLLAGIDPATCAEEFTFGRDGKPFYIRGPFESLAEAAVISQRVKEAGGHFLVGGPGASLAQLTDTADDWDDDEWGDDDVRPI